jgi:hypothetical protein
LLNPIFFSLLLDSIYFTWREWIVPCLFHFYIWRNKHCGWWAAVHCHAQEVLGSNVGYPDRVFLNSPGQMPGGHLKLGHNHFYILSDSLFTNHCIIWHCVVWATDSIIK